MKDWVIARFSPANPESQIANEKMIDEPLEFLISQYADGSLPESERAGVELRLQTDVEAQALLNEYRRLDASLKTLIPLPVVNWDRLAEHLSETVAEERETGASTVLGRIGNFGRLALAASIVLAVGGIALWTQVKPRPGGGSMVSNPVPGGGRTAPPAVVLVRGPAPQAPASQPVVLVTAGPSSNVTPNWRAGEGVVTGPSRAVWIASGYDPAQDTQRLPY